MKKIEDYIHLYYGCDVQFKYPDWEQWNNRSVTGEMIRDLKEDSSLEVRLVLRKLSSITEEDLNIPNFSDGYTLEREQYGDKGNWLIDDKSDFGYTIELYDDGSMNCVCKDNGENYPYHGAEITRQLLSKGFDLFGLIESGIAVDRDTLNQLAQ